MSDAIRTIRAPAPVGAYPHARRVGNLLFLSGVGPRMPGTNEIPGNVYDAANALRLERKQDMRRRGLASPDDGDALALTFAYPVVPRSETDDLRTEDLVRNLKRRVV